ncbi:MAG TPA: hypothetical protein VF691_00050 [Cytophagaceae bacterium]|jgi:hypothetical protein
MEDILTWRAGSGLVDWTYNLWKSSEAEHMKKLLADDEYRRNWIAEKIERVLYALKNFAEVESIKINTRSRGEDTLVIEDCQGAMSHTELLDFLQKTDDVVHVNFDLMLHCVELGIDGKQKKLEVKSGGTIFFVIELDDNGSLYTDNEDPIWFSFSLEVDIYAPLSWGRCRDNTELATMNGPRLSTFLHRLEDQIPAEFEGVDAPDYPDAGRYGFLEANKLK